MNRLPSSFEITVEALEMEKSSRIAVRYSLEALLKAHPLALIEKADLQRQSYFSAVDGPWYIVDLDEGETFVKRFAIWKFTGDVYQLDALGAIDDDTGPLQLDFPDGPRKFGRLDLDRLTSLTPSEIREKHPLIAKFFDSQGWFVPGLRDQPKQWRLP